MVYKRYIIKNGKRHGPYYYESYREGDKIRKRYLGDHLPAVVSSTPSVEQPSRFSSRTIVLILLFVMLTLAGLWYIPFLSTGNVVLNINASYAEGEPIAGTFNVGLVPGEFVPQNALVRAELGEHILERPLSDLIDEEPIPGNFFVKDGSLSGNGEGYGVPGTITTYPELTFAVRVTRDAHEKKEDLKEKSEEEQEKKEKNDSFSEDAHTSESESSSDEPESAQETSAPESNPSSDASSTSETASESDTNVKKEKDESNQKDEGESKVPETKEEKDAGKSEEHTSEEPAKGEKTSDVSESAPAEEAASSENSAPSAPAVEAQETPTEISVPLTGAVISSDERVILGNVSKGTEFRIFLDKKERAAIVPGSVLWNGDSVAESSVDLTKEGQEVIVSTVYEARESGFGKDYLNDSKVIKTLIIDLVKLGLNASSGTLKISLMFGNETLVSAEQMIEIVSRENVTPPNVNNESLRNESVTPVNQTLNHTQSNATLINATALSLVTPLSTVKLVNGSAVIDLSTYFGIAERYVLNASNISASVVNQTMTITADAGKTITNAGTFTASTSGTLVVKGDFTGILLAQGDKIEFTINLQIT